jgi:hypothetical protein
MILTQSDLKKKIKRTKVTGWVFLVLGTWVSATALLLIFVAKIGYNSPVTMNVIFGAAGVVWGFKKLNEAKRLCGEGKAR